MLTWVLNVITAALQTMPETVLDGASDVVKAELFANSSNIYNLRDARKKYIRNVHFF